MTHSVPPPEPLPIVQTLPPEAIRSASIIASVPVADTQSLTVRTPSTTLAESSAPETSPFSAAKSAAVLGPPISVGYPIKSAETPNSSSSVAEAVAAPLSSATELNNSGQSPSEAIATPQAVSVSRQRSNQTTTYQRKSQPIPPFQPSASVEVNKLLASKESLPVQAGSAQKDNRPGLNDTSASPTSNPVKFGFQAPIETQPTPSPAPSNNSEQPVELDFQAPIETQPTPSPIPAEQIQPVVPPVPVPTQTQPTPQPQTQPSEPSPSPTTAPAGRRIVEVTSDRQEYDEQRQIVTAEGNVIVRFDGAVLDADRLQVNLPNLIAVGEGNVALTRGQQVLRGERFTYNFVQDLGNIQNGSGEIFIPTASTDFAGTLPTDVTAGGVPQRPPSDRMTAEQPLQQVTSPGGIAVTVGGGRGVSNLPLPQQGGVVRRLRFEAEQIEFYPQGWQARDVRITNDPFSPPELELRADRVTSTRETPFRERIRTTRQRLVFDRGFSLPIPRNQAVIDQNRRDVSPGIAQFGYDGGDRGGLFVERGFTPIDTNSVQLSLRPQFFAQKAVQESGGNIFDPSLFGLRANLNATLGARTSVTGVGVFTSLDPNEIEDNLRASLRFRQIVGTNLPHTLNLEYSYRDRLYNGTLGFQTVQSSLGGVISSPIIPLGDGFNLSYQAGAQYISADTDRPDLLEPVRENNRVSLSRLQGTAALSRGFLLWQGQGLPATATEGLRYTPAPVVPYLSAYAGVTGTSSFYGSGDNQTLLIGTVGLQGQFGNFSRSFLDYTGFNISYSQGIRSGLSPFLFDRAADTKILSVGLTQQIYGPFRLGVQTAINLDTGESLSTDYTLEYSRRTYGIILRYNPVQELGSIGLRISDFNWFGGTDPFSGGEVRPVVGGVRRLNE
jgi:hypothetical protein